MPITLSRNEKKSLGLHLALSLIIIGVFGISLIIIGYNYNRMYLFLTGFFFSFIPPCIFLVYSFIEYRKNLKTLRKPHIDFINEIYLKMDDSFNIVTELKKEFPSLSNQNTSIDTTKWSKAGFIHFLSLERVIYALEERLSQVEPELNSFYENNVLNAIEKLNEPLTFENKTDKHLLDHNMPDMPKSSWLDSLEFLNAKVMEEKNKIKNNKKNPMNSV